MSDPVPRDTVLEGPHGPLPTRLYIPKESDGSALVWAHGGSFMGGDLDSAETHWVADSLCATGTTVLTVDYRLAPPTPDLEEILGRTGGVHYPVPMDELAFCFIHARSLDLTGELRWSLGGASAGAALAAGAALHLRDHGPVTPETLVLIYPLLHHVIPAATSELRAALSHLPEQHRFGAADVAMMNDNYLGSASADSPYAFAGGKDLHSLPPTLIVTSDVDGLRPSGEAFATELANAGVPHLLENEPGTLHGHLSTPDHPGASATIDRIAAWLRRPAADFSPSSVLTVPKASSS